MAQKRKSAKIRVENTTRGCILAETCTLANTFWSRGLGLMGRSHLEGGHGLIIYPGWSIHTCFMRFPIDVLFVDAQDRVAGLVEALPPYRLFAGQWGARYVIELPANILRSSGTQKGDQLLLTPSPHLEYGNRKYG